MSERDARLIGSITGQEPRFATRVRVENGYTVKDGHNYNSTVEVTYECDESQLDEMAEQARLHLRSELRIARDEAIKERDARNKADGR